MARDGGRIVIVSDLSPKRLLHLAEHLAYAEQYRLEDLIDEERDGFHIGDERGGGLYGTRRVPLDIEVFADRTTRGEGRITLDWWKVGDSWRVVHWFANELERRIENDDGEVLESYDE